MANPLLEARQRRGGADTAPKGKVQTNDTELRRKLQERLGEQGGSSNPLLRARQVRSGETGQAQIPLTPKKPNEGEGVGRTILRSLTEVVPQTGLLIGQAFGSKRKSIDLPLIGTVKVPETARERAAYAIDAAITLSPFIIGKIGKGAVAAGKTAVAAGKTEKAVAKAGELVARFRSGEKVIRPTEGTKFFESAEEAAKLTQSIEPTAIEKQAKTTLSGRAKPMEQLARREQKRRIAELKKLQQQLPLAGGEAKSVQKLLPTRAAPTQEMKLLPERTPLTPKEIANQPFLTRKELEAIPKKQIPIVSTPSVEVPIKVTIKPKIAKVIKPAAVEPITQAAKVAEKTRFFSKLTPAKLGAASVYGAAGSTSMALKDANKSARDVVKDAAIGAVFGPALLAGGAGVVSTLRLGANSKLAQVFYNTGLYKHMVGEASKVLERMSPGSKQAARLLRFTREEIETSAADDFAKIKNTVGTLSKNERKLFESLAQGGRVMGYNPTPGMQKALQTWNEIRSRYAQVAKDLKINVTHYVKEKIKTEDGPEVVAWVKKTRPFEAMDFYFPRIVDTTKFTRTGRQRAIDFLVQSRQADNAGDAERLLSSFIKLARQRRAGNLEYSRQFGLPDEFYIQDTMEVLSRYIRDSQRRFREIIHYGADDAKLYSLISDIENSEDRKLAERIISRVLGKDDAEEPAFLHAARQIQNMSLGLATISNVTQSVNTAVKFGYARTARGLFNAFTKEGREFALKSSAILETTMQDLNPYSSVGSLEGMNRILFKVTGFTATERMNRSIAANTGRFYAMDMYQKLLKNPTNKVLRDGLAEIGLHPDNLLRDPLVGLSDKRLLIAGLRASNATQFRSSALDLPLFFSSPYGRFITQFKNFAFKQGQFMMKEVLGQASKGNFAPLIRLAAATSVFGEASADVKALARGNTDRWESEGVKRWLENLASIGGFGLLQDTAMSAAKGSFSTMRALAGPTVVDVADLLSASASLAGGEPEPIAKFGTAQIPIIGPKLKSTLFPSK